MEERKKANLKSIYGTPFKFDSELKIWKSVPDFILFAIFLTYILISIIFLTTYSYYEVKHTSMQPLLNNYTQEELDAGVGDGVYVNTLATSEVGDVIVVKYAFDPNVDSVVKRLIGVSGDKIAIKEVLLSDNVTKRYEILRIAKGNTVPYILVENYLSEQNQIVGMKTVYDNFQIFLSNTENTEEINGQTYLVLQDDEIFYLGDNRGSSRDCSEYGPVKASQIIGRVDIVVYRQENMFFQILEYMLGFKTV